MRKKCCNFSANITSLSRYIKHCKRFILCLSFFLSNFYVNQNHAHQSKNMQHVQTIFRICNLKETSIDRIFKQLLSRNCVQQTVKYVTKTWVVNKLKLLVYLSFFETWNFGIKHPKIIDLFLETFICTCTVYVVCWRVSDSLFQINNKR